MHTHTHIHADAITFARKQAPQTHAEERVSLQETSYCRAVLASDCPSLHGALLAVRAAQS